MDESEFLFSSMTPKKNINKSIGKKPKKRPSFLVVKKHFGRTKALEHAPRRVHNESIIVITDSEESFQSIENSDKSKLDYKSCESSLIIPETPPKLVTGDTPYKRRNKLDIQKWVNDVNAQNSTKIDESLSYDNFTNNALSKNIVNSTIIQPISIIEVKTPNVFKSKTQNVDAKTETNNYDSDDSAKSIKNLLDQLYGTAWRKNQDEIVPKSENLNRIKKISREKFNTASKPKTKTCDKENTKNNKPTQTKIFKGITKKELNISNSNSSSEPEKAHIKPKKLFNDEASSKKDVKNKQLRSLSMEFNSFVKDIIPVKASKPGSSKKKSANVRNEIQTKKIAYLSDDFDPIIEKNDVFEKNQIKLLTDRLETLQIQNKKKSPIKKFNVKKYTFLSSLSKNVPINECDYAARIFRNNFQQNRAELTQRLVKMFNEQVFDKGLGELAPVEWSERLLNTAGFCRCKKLIKNGEIISRTAQIVLSSKVIDSPDRLRDTLIHELCHAATWIINKVSNGHGPFWKAWTLKASQTFPELPPIKVCHDYVVNTKYTYKCTECGYSFGRHKKSIDLERKRCGHCLGKFEVLLNKILKNGESKSIPSTPRKPNEFALFVKENYNTVRSASKISHKDVMKELAEQFKQAKIKN